MIYPKIFTEKKYQNFKYNSHYLKTIGIISINTLSVGKYCCLCTRSISAYQQC